MDSCFESLAKVDSGNYLFNAKGFWHGGVHFTGGALSDAEGDTKPVCAIADGELVAYRLNPDYTYDKDDTKKEHGYSTGFFLLRHKLAYPADNMLTLFSLYMHTGRFNYLVKTDGAKVRDASAAEKDKLSTGTMLLLDDGTEVEIGGYKRYKILSIFGKNIGSDARYIYTKAVEKLDTGAVVVPPEPMKVHAGDPLGLVGEYNNAPSSNKKVLHLELFTADDVKAFAETAQKKYPTDTSAERPQPTSMIIPSGTVLYRKEEVAAKKVKEGVTHTNLRKAYASGEAGYNTVKEAKTGVILEIDESTLSHDRYKVLKNAGVDVSAQNWTVHKDYIVDSTYDAYTLSETRTNKERNLPIEETKPRVKDMEGKEYFELSSMYVAIEDCTPDHGITFRWVKAFDTASTDNASIFTNFMAHFKKEIGPNELSVNPLYQELFDAIDKSGNDVKGNGKIDYPLEIDKAVKSADVRKLASRYAVKHASEWGDTLQKFWDEMQTHLDGLVSSAETDKERKDRGANAKHMANQTARAKKLKFFPECKGKIKESNTTGAGAFPASDIVYFLHPIRVVGEMGSAAPFDWAKTPIVKLIASKESKGSYGAYNITGWDSDGNNKTYESHFTGKGTYNIETMTISEIKAAQAKREGVHKKHLFAVGFYQVIPRTLEHIQEKKDKNGKVKKIIKTGFLPWIKSKKKIDESTQLFDKKFQDLMPLFFWESKKTDIGNYFRGKITVEDAAYAVAKEWASAGVPKGKTTKNGVISDGSKVTYFDDTALNKAHYPATETMKALKETKKMLDNAGGYEAILNNSYSN